MEVVEGEVGEEELVWVHGEGCGGLQRTVRTGACAAIGVVAELMDVHAALGGGVAAVDVVGDGCWGGFGGLFEGHGTANGRFTAEDCD